MDGFMYGLYVDKSEYPTETAIITHVREAMKRSLYEHSDRSMDDGGLEDVIEIIDRKFPTLDEAQDWLVESCENGGSVLIVSTDALWVYGALRPSDEV